MVGVGPSRTSERCLALPPHLVALSAWRRPVTGGSVVPRSLRHDGAKAAGNCHLGRCRCHRRCRHHSL